MGCAGAQDAGAHYGFQELHHRQIVMSPSQSDSEFMNQAEALLRAVELACDRINDGAVTDIDNQRVGGMVTLVFENRSQIVVNLQKPLHEVWLAARSGGYHFRWVDGHWQDTKGQGEFFAILTRDASAQSGAALDFRQPGA
jgi:CyaY protein